MPPMPNCRQIFLCFLLCICALGMGLHGYGQRYETTYITTENGLPSNGIKGLQWDDSTHFLWVATEAGLVRYNGKSFVVFRKDNTPYMQLDRTSLILKTSAGAIYAATERMDILHINNNLPELYRKGPNKNEIIGSDVIGSWGLQVSEQFSRSYTPNTQFHKVMDMLAGDLASIVPLTDTSCLIFRRGLAMYYCSQNKSYRLFNNMFDANIQFAFKIGNQCFLMDKTDALLPLLPNQQIGNSLTIMASDGRPLQLPTGKRFLYWSGGNKKPILVINHMAWQLTYINKKIIATLICNAVPTDAMVITMFYWQAGKTLFIATGSKGLVVIKEQDLEPKKSLILGADKLNGYYSQIVLGDSAVLTNEGVVIGHAPKNIQRPTNTFFGYNTYLFKDSILWFTKEDSLFTYQYRTHQKIFRLKNQESDKTALVQCGDTIYMADATGIRRYNSASASFTYLHHYQKEKAWNCRAFEMVSYKPGILILATFSGLLQFNIHTKHLDTLLNTGNLPVRSLWKYKDYLFIGTYGKGFYIMKNGVIKSMPLDKNNYLLYTHTFIDDANGFCWMSTNKGLFKAKLSDLVAAFENNTQQIYYHYFGKSDGMVTTELNGGGYPAVVRLGENMLSFVTMDGLLWVNSATTTTTLPTGNIYIDNVTVDSTQYSVDSFQNIILPYALNDIDVQLAFPAWANQENMYLQYQLSNKPNQWQTVKTGLGNIVINISNLSYGNYTLTIRKLNGFGINNYSYKTIHFSIATPWYKKWWFYTLIVLSIFLLLNLYLRLQAKQHKKYQQALEKEVAERTAELYGKNETLEKNDRIKTRLISIISHDIITPLKFLHNASKTLLKNQGHISEELQSETIEEIANTSKDLELLSTNILNWIKYQQQDKRLQKHTVNLYDIVKQVFSLLNPLAKQKNISLINEIPADYMVHQYVEPLKIVLYNFVVNSVNFSTHGSICVSVSVVNNWVSISVKDQGVGMTKEQINNIISGQYILSSANVDNKKGNGLGYLIIKELLEIMQATMHIASQKNEGTVVNIGFEDRVS